MGLLKAIFGDYSEKEIIATNNVFPKDLESLKFCLGNESEGKKILVKLKGFNNKYENNLKLYFSQDYKEKNRSEISKQYAKELMLKNSTIKVTQMESFYDCPFKHFVSYALKPVIKQKAEIKKNQKGTIYHSLLEEFVSKYSERLSEVSTKEVENFIDLNLKKYIDESIIEFIDNRQVLEKELSLSAKTLCERVVYESKYSKYKPV